jgi:hypothetical protein
MAAAAMMMSAASGSERYLIAKKMAHSTSLKGEDMSVFSEADESPVRRIIEMRINSALFTHFLQ